MRPFTSALLNTPAKTSSCFFNSGGNSAYHRDIAPDNVILLQGSDRPLLLDFGSARRVIGDMTQALTVILKPGYAPVSSTPKCPA
ncbi:MAG: hypothetical protein M3Y55_03975 [Pseudomonadota bacterium]|nr:hypothetical protein [Pseudomonadota bacterium]